VSKDLKIEQGRLREVTVDAYDSHGRPVQLDNLVIESTAPNVVRAEQSPDHPNTVRLYGVRSGSAHVIVKGDVDANGQSPMPLVELLAVAVEGGCRVDMTQMTLELAQPMGEHRKKRMTCAAVRAADTVPCGEIATQLVEHKTSRVRFAVCVTHSRYFIQQGTVRHLRPLGKLRVGDASRSDPLITPALMVGKPVTVEEEDEDGDE